MRVKNTFINSIAGIISQVILMIFSFYVRKIFIDYLGNAYLGINSVYASLLQFLNLAELGISSAIIFNLYGPLANGDQDKITYLMIQYKKIYKKIGLIILLIGLVIMIFINIFMEGITFDLSYLRITFFVQLIGTVSTYFFAYKRSLLLADQKNYICQIIDTIVSIVSYLCRIFVLVFFESFILYLVIQVLQNIFSNIICSIYCDKYHPYVKKGVYNKSNVNELTLNNDIKNVAIYKIASFIYTSSDSLIISKFISTIVLGIFSNYKLIIDFVSTLLAQVTNAVLSSLGNFINSGKSKEEVYNLIDFYTFICFSIGTFCCISFLSLFQPTIFFWLGKDNLLEYTIIITSCMYFFLRQIRTPIGNLYYAMGMYRHDKVGMLITAAINISFSIILSIPLGLNGVFIGTILADFFYLLFSTYIIFREYFKTSPFKYLSRVMLYCFIAIIECIICVSFSNIIFQEFTIWNFICRILICLVIPNILNIGLLVKFGYSKKLNDLIISLKGGV